MLKRVSIQNFKSLKDVTLDLQKVNLLIGPNNSGKTNFLKALAYFGKNNKIHSEEPDPSKIAYRHLNGAIKIEFKFDVKNKDYSIKEYDYQVFECQINPNGTVMRSNSYQDLGDPYIKILDAKEKLFEQDEFEQKVGSLIIYKPDTNKIDKPGPVGDGTETVNSDASNLVGFLDLMLGKYRRTTFSQIEIDLHKCIPEFVEINLEDVKPTDILFRLHNRDKGSNAFKRIGLTDGRQNTIYWGSAR
ncbi:AAA family ATPase [Spirosoma endbachense]|uniref:AAA family ATPase n=1 Tax=Spirosoma endbachense TaxID=2666025 RepID=A0A6P1W248_9BACT|nr:AAA family ATPase [Spirosoma endbachense]QHV98964.1 AAA family ATPase [Spirosoma endbachense]